MDSFSYPGLKTIFIMRINLDPASDQTGAGINKIYKKPSRSYETFSDQELEIVYEDGVDVIYMNDPVIFEAGTKMEYLTAKNLKNAYEKIISNFRTAMDLSKDNKLLNTLKAFLLEEAPKETTSQFNVKLVEYAKNGAGLCFEIKDQQANVFNPLDHATFNLPFVCTKQSNSKRDGRFDLGKLIIGGGAMQIHNHDGKINRDDKGNDQKFEFYMDELKHGAIYEINVNNNSNYENRLMVLGKGPKGFGSGKMKLSFQDFTTDNPYSLKIRNSSKEWHYVRYSSKNPTIRYFTWDQPA